MAKNWAIAIGINQYNPNNFAPLRYARRDAELMRDFFQEARFDEIHFFAENAANIALPSGASIPTYPSYGNLLSFLEDRFEHPFLSAGDNCWFFFAGHGMQYANRDYLMPIDANPRNVDRTAIPVSYVRERLSRCGADNVILMLDACRNEGSRDGVGVGRETQPGIITISACSPTERSWEIDELQQGAFTYALLEAFRLNGAGNCATVERLSQYLRHHVPELCRRYGKAPSQTPNTSVDPLEKYHYILLPQHATLADVATLKTDAYRLAFIENKPLLAKQICIRAIAAAMGRDMELLELFARIQQLPNSSVNAPSQSFGEGRSPLDSPSTIPLQNPTSPSQKTKPSTPPSVSPKSPTPIPAVKPTPTPQSTPNPTPPHSTGDRSTKARSATRPMVRPVTWGVAGIALVVGLNLFHQQLGSNQSALQSTSPTPAYTQQSESPIPAYTPLPSYTPSYVPLPYDSPSPSSRLADYSQLENSLKEQQWNDADLETKRLMLKIAGREQERSLDSESLQNFPCNELSRIDQLWFRYSSGRFGFSVQKRIWEEVSRSTEKNVDAQFEAFGDRVGWRPSGEWQTYSANPSLSTSPQGNFPSSIWFSLSFLTRISSGSFSAEGAQLLLSRTNVCEL